MVAPSVTVKFNRLGCDPCQYPVKSRGGGAYLSNLRISRKFIQMRNSIKHCLPENLRREMLRVHVGEFG